MCNKLLKKAISFSITIFASSKSSNGESIFDQVINSQNQGEEFSFELSKELQAADQT